MQWTYVGSGATSVSWTVNMPADPGDYEFRLFENGGYSRIATSPTVTVEPLSGGQPSLEVSATSVSGGKAVTVTLENGPGGNADWIALAAVGSSDTAYFQWTYVSPGSASMSWTVNMPDNPGDYEFRLFANGSYTRVATSPAVTVQPPASTEPSLDVSATSVSGGDTVTVTLTNGPGNSNDWLALAKVGASNGSYLKWSYVGSGATSMTWTVNMPTIPDDYEFRLFEKGGYTLLATSPPVVVNP
jgi:hypothetical protein